MPDSKKDDSSKKAEDKAMVDKLGFDKPASAEVSEAKIEEPLVKIVEPKESQVELEQKIKVILKDGGMDSQMQDRQLDRIKEVLGW